MRVFVTGAGGFVGSNLVHVLAERHGATWPDLDTTLARLRHDLEHMTAGSPL